MAIFVDKNGARHSSHAPSKNVVKKTRLVAEPNKPLDADKMALEILYVEGERKRNALAREIARRIIEGESIYMYDPKRGIHIFVVSRRDEKGEILYKVYKVIWKVFSQDLEVVCSSLWERDPNAAAWNVADYASFRKRQQRGKWITLIREYYPEMRLLSSEQTEEIKKKNPYRMIKGKLERNFKLKIFGSIPEIFMGRA